MFILIFPEDRNCEICKRTKITRAPCRRRNGEAVPRADNFGDLITADHKVLSDNCESRNNHRYAVVVQDLATQWIQAHPCKTITSQETQRSCEQIGQHFIVKDRGTLGPRHWDKKVMTILHRVLTWVHHSDNGPERIEYEADPRHREVLSLQLGLADGKTRSVTSPFEKIKITPDTERELQESEAAVFRSAVMRLCFLALDRPDIQFGAKEAARGMARPTVRHQRMLKRCARYLLQAKTLT